MNQIDDAAGVRRELFELLFDWREVQLSRERAEQMPVGPLHRDRDDQLALPRFVVPIRIANELVLLSQRLQPILRQLDRGYFLRARCKHPPGGIEHQQLVEVVKSLVK